MAHDVVITPEARGQLEDIYDYIADAASPGTALRFTDGIIDHLARLADYPRIGTSRDDIRQGLRTLIHRRRVTIAFVVEDAAVIIIGFFYAGRDLEAVLRDEQT